MSHRNVTVPHAWAEFSTRPTDRHEQLVAQFGKRIMQLRRQAIGIAERLIQNSSARDKLGSIRRVIYERCAQLPPEAQKAALALSEVVADNFLYLVLTLIAGTGIDERLDEDYAINWRLVAEILDIEADKVVHEEVINRDGEKFFPEYWGRWLNMKIDEERKIPEERK